MSTVARLVFRVAVAVVLSTVLFAPSAGAQSCSTLLLDHQNWVESQPNGPGTYSLHFTMVMNRLTQSAAFAEGSLQLKYLLFQGPRFSGTGTYYLSTERWNFPCAPNEFCPAVNPFDPDKADPVSVSINPATGQASLTTSGSTRTLDLLCDHLGVLYGVADPAGFLDLAPPMYVFSLKRAFVPQVN